MPITPEVLDQILKDYEQPEDLLSENGLLQQLTKAVVERALNGEMTHQLGYGKHSPAGNNSGNSRNGSTLNRSSSKRIRRALTAWTKRLFLLRQRDDNARDSRTSRRDLRVDVSPSLISNVTDAVIENFHFHDLRHTAATDMFDLRAGELYGSNCARLR